MAGGCQQADYKHWEAINSTYQDLGIANEVKTILIPEITLSTLNSLLNKLPEYSTKIRNVDVAPGAFSLSYLHCLSSLDGDSGELGNLDTALVDRAVAFAVDNRWKDKSGLGVFQVDEVVVCYSCFGVLGDEGADLFHGGVVIVQLGGALSVGVVHDIGD